MTAIRKKWISMEVDFKMDPKTRRNLILTALFSVLLFSVLTGITIFLKKRLNQNIAGLKKSEEKYRRLFDNAVEGVFQTTRDGRFLSANPSLARILGYSSASELIEHLQDIKKQHYLNPEDRERFLQIMETSGETSDFEVQLRKRDGSPIWAGIKARPVSDDGCGMDQEILKNLFEPFFTTKEVGKGTGLGLATIYGIIKQNNGFINVYSEPGQGSTFKIYLPRHHASPEKEASAVHSEEPAPTGNETILLVEDEPGILEMTRTMIEQKGYTVLSAASPAAAVQMGRDCTDRIHLLITDVIMPEMNGRDLAEQMRSLFPDIRVLFMSGYTANVIVHQGMLDKGVDFLQKPFSTNDLALKVRQVME